MKILTYLLFFLVSISTDLSAERVFQLLGHQQFIRFQQLLPKNLEEEIVHLNLRL